MSDQDISLSALERDALRTLCAEVLDIRAPVDAVSFRATYELFRPVMRRLQQLRYVDEDGQTQTYIPTVLGLKEVGTEECNQILERGSRMLALFYKHYKNAETRKQNLFLKDIAVKLGVDRQELNFTMTLLSGAVSSTSSGRTTNFQDEDAYVIPSESIFDYLNIDSIIDQYAGYRQQAIGGIGGISWASEDEVPLRAPEAAFFNGRFLVALPEKFHKILKEIDIANANGLTCLTVTGLRAVIDEFAVEQVGDMGTFEKKLRAMEQKRVLNANQIEILRAALEVGHAAAHRMHVPSEDECHQVLEIVEHMLREVYVLTPGARKLKDSAPAREKSRT